MMNEEYNSLTHHVAMRDGLPSAIRPTLLEEARQDWKAHARYAGKAQFFMNIHRQLLDGADWLAAKSGAFLDVSQNDLRDQLASSDLTKRSSHLLHFAHGHHEIEDHGYFPQFIQLYPQLERAMSLLDGDHLVLNETLNGVETAIDALRNPNRDTVALLYRNAAALKKIMHRHITDEEEVIIPIFLRNG